MLNRMGTADAQGVVADFALANGLSSAEPRGVAIDEALRVLYVADSANHRVLRYDSMDTISATTWPAAVFGQLDFAGRYANQGLSAPSQGSICYPWGVWVDAASTLWVADTGNGRVVGQRACSRKRQPRHRLHGPTFVDQRHVGSRFPLRSQGGGLRCGWNPMGSRHQQVV